MEHTEPQKEIKLPVIQRVDRLELLLNYIEVQKNIPAETEEIDHGCDPCKDLSTVLEEVSLRGSLMERVASLERRVLKLTQQLDDERSESLQKTQQLEDERSESLNKLSVKSCRCALEDKSGGNNHAIQNEDQNGASTQDKELEEKKIQMCELDSKEGEQKSKRKINTNSRYRKWLASISTRCS